MCFINLAGFEGRRAEIHNRIMENVSVEDRGYETPCHVWQGQNSGEENGKQGRGYPRMTLNGETVAVHRVNFVNHEGYVPRKKHIDHKCRTRLCVRYEHLEMVSAKENFKRRDKANGVVRRRKNTKKTKSSKCNPKKLRAVRGVVGRSQRQSYAQP